MITACHAGPTQARRARPGLTGTHLSWEEAEAYTAEHERLRAAAAHVALAVAALTRAREQVGDNAATVALRELTENLQLVQSQLATSAEKAFSMAELSRQRARHQARQRQVEGAAGDDRLDP